MRKPIPAWQVRIHPGEARTSAGSSDAGPPSKPGDAAGRAKGDGFAALMQVMRTQQRRASPQDKSVVRPPDPGALQAPGLAIAALDAPRFGPGPDEGGPDGRSAEGHDGSHKNPLAVAALQGVADVVGRVELLQRVVTAALDAAEAAPAQEAGSEMVVPMSSLGLGQGEIRLSASENVLRIRFCAVAMATREALSARLDELRQQLLERLPAMSRVDIEFA